MESHNARTALTAPARFGRLVSALVVHGAICGGVSCPMPELPAMRYEGHLEGGALVAGADGAILALRRGPIPAIAWHTRRLHGRRRYESHVRRKARR